MICIAVARRKTLSVLTVLESVEKPINFMLSDWPAICAYAEHQLKAFYRLTNRWILKGWILMDQRGEFSFNLWASSFELPDFWAKREGHCCRIGFATIELMQQLESFWQVTLKIWPEPWIRARQWSSQGACAQSRKESYQRHRATALIHS